MTNLSGSVVLVAAAAVLSGCAPMSPVGNFEVTNPGACRLPGPDVIAKDFGVDVDFAYNYQAAGKQVHDMTAKGKVTIDSAIEHVYTRSPSVIDFQIIYYYYCEDCNAGRPEGCAQLRELKKVTNERLKLTPWEVVSGSTKTLRTNEIDCAQQTCVDILREADFTKLACDDGKGHPVDVVELKDTITLTKDVSVYRPIAKRLRGQEVDLFDLNGNSPEKLPPVRQSDPNSDVQDIEWTVTPKNKEVKLRWVWRNAHSSNNEGLGFENRFPLRNVTATYRFPNGVQPKNKTAFPPEKCVPQDDKCSDVELNSASFDWEWNAWTRCKH